MGTIDTLATYSEKNCDSLNLNTSIYGNHDFDRKIKKFVGKPLPTRQ